MDRAALGNSGVSVSRLGLGAMAVGSDALSEADAGRLLNAALDAGISLIDTARSYGLAEERIGRHLANRRDEYVLSTKVGYGVEGVPDWTYDAVARGVDDARRRLATDHIDIVHLHSCPVSVLETGIADALSEARRNGKIGLAAYSGEQEDLQFALDSGLFQVIQTSVNVCDQNGLRRLIPKAVHQGIGVLAKRPLANAPWRFDDRPRDPNLQPYWDRWQFFGDGLGGEDPQDVTLRFAAYAPGVSAALVGTANAAHLAAAAEAVARGPLSPEVQQTIADVFDRHGQDWEAQL